jgi:tetratricopeptide (TPR) repeat protein
MTRRTPLSCLLSSFLLLGFALACAHEDEDATGNPPEKLGEVTFPVSCNAEAQKEFNRAMALFHSFWFDPAKKSFGKVLEHDPGCGMAQWGIAFMSMGNPFAWPANANGMKNAEAALGEAQRIGVKSDRERDYVAALAQFLKDWESVDHRTRAVAFEKSMEGVATRYPEDDEAKILHALLLDATALASDKTFANQLRAGAILEPLYTRYPHHPGVAHYLIHTYDYAELAEKGLPFARVYADIAPSVPHALHMPSHIFSRVGLWQEMIEGNRASYRAAKAEMSETNLGIGVYDALHAMDYMVFGLLQQGQDEAALELANEVAAISNVNTENFVAAYALASIPARTALEHGDWKQAAALKLSPSTLSWNKYPQAEAILVFARGLGAARTGDVEAARADAKRLETLKEAMSAYWANQADFQIKAVNAWISAAQGRKDEALSLMRASAQAEEASDKHPVTPGNVVPSRVLLGEMLLSMNQPAEALREFQQSLRRDPNRFRTISGAARAAEAAGNAKAAREYYGRLLALTTNRDSERPEITYAAAYMEKRE